MSDYAKALPPSSTIAHGGTNCPTCGQSWDAPFATEEPACWQCGAALPDGELQRAALPSLDTIREVAPEVCRPEEAA